jgi:hypothetical protein
MRFNFLNEFVLDNLLASQNARELGAMQTHRPRPGEATLQPKSHQQQKATKQAKMTLQKTYKGKGNCELIPMSLTKKKFTT